MSGVKQQICFWRYLINLRSLWTFTAMYYNEDDVLYFNNIFLKIIPTNKTLGSISFSVKNILCICFQSMLHFQAKQRHFPQYTKTSACFLQYKIWRYRFGDDNRDVEKFPSGTARGEVGALNKKWLVSRE